MEASLNRRKRKEIEGTAAIGNGCHIYQATEAKGKQSIQEIRRFIDPLRDVEQKTPE